jgi:[NiFe] hydrogenase diaphorase moiety large subunit
LRPPRLAAALRRIVNTNTPSEAAIEAAVQAALRAWPPDPTHTLQVLRETQERLGWLPEAALARVAASLGVSIATVRGVVAFYSFLYAEPMGEYRVLFSDNVTDRMRGSEDRLREVCQKLWVEPGKVSEDGLVSVDRCW